MLSILHTLAQSYTYTTTSSADSAAAAVAALMAIVIATVLIGAAYIFTSVCLSKIFKKAGRPDAWAAWIPVYQMWVYFELAGRPGWWGLLTLINPISWVVSIVGGLDIAKRFGKDAIFGVVLGVFPIIGFAILAFGDSEYQVPVANAQPERQVPPLAQ